MSDLFDQSELMRMTDINLKGIERDVALLRMSMETDDLTGVYVYSDAIKKSLDVISSFTTTLYTSENDIREV